MRQDLGQSRGPEGRAEEIQEKIEEDFMTINGNNEGITWAPARSSTSVSRVTVDPYPPVDPQIGPLLTTTNELPVLLG